MLFDINFTSSSPLIYLIVAKISSFLLCSEIKDSIRPRIAMDMPIVRRIPTSRSELNGINGIPNIGYKFGSSK